VLAQHLFFCVQVIHAEALGSGEGGAVGGAHKTTRLPTIAGDGSVYEDDGACDIRDCSSDVEKGGDAGAPRGGTQVQAAPAALAMAPEASAAAAVTAPATALMRSHLSQESDCNHHDDHDSLTVPAHGAPVCCKKLIPAASVARNTASLSSNHAATARMLSLAAALEAHSSHPMAPAIVGYAAANAAYKRCVGEGHGVGDQ
jgi:hypothetical protein